MFKILKANLESDLVALYSLNKMISPDETIEDFKLYIKSFNFIAYKSIVEQEIVGFISLIFPLWNQVGIIQHLVVHPNFRKNRIATELLNSIIKESQNQKLRFLTVQTADWNIEAISLYLKLNFIKKANFSDYYGDKSNLCWLELNLNSTNPEVISQPIIETNRLSLRPLHISMAEEIFSYASNNEIAKYVPWQPHKSVQDTNDFISMMRLNHSSIEGRIFFVWGIEEKLSKKIIGTIDFKQPATHIGQIDYALGINFWGKGLMTEAALAVLNWAKENFPKIIRYQSFAVNENTASKKVMEKMGLRFEGLRKKQLFFKNCYRDMVYYAIVEEFDLQPVLKGEQVTIRPLRKDEFEPLFNVASDPRIWEQHPQKERYKREVFQKYFDSAVLSGGAVVIEDGNQNIIGASRFYDYNFKKSQVTIGYTFLSRNCWGGCYNKEVKNLMLDHAFKFVDRVIFEIGENNTRSRRAIEKIGAKFIRSETLDGVTRVVYEIKKIHW